MKNQEIHGRFSFMLDQLNTQTSIREKWCGKNLPLQSHLVWVRPGFLSHALYLTDWDNLMYVLQLLHLKPKPTPYNSRWNEFGFKICCSIPKALFMYCRLRLTFNFMSQSHNFLTCRRGVSFLGFHQFMSICKGINHQWWYSR